jgi:glucosamine--fructose-6-phosphate aminotransferase (isomerizing)
VGKGEMFLASDALALVGTTERIAFLEEGDVAEIGLESFRVRDAAGHEAKREVRTVQAGNTTVELGPYRHYMQKEIFEQPSAVADTLEGVEAVSPALFGKDAQRTLRGVRQVLVLACGTSYYSGLTAKCWFESLARLPTQVEIASEYRYRDSVPDPATLVVVVSQSGETADTLAALRHARELGQKRTLAICNVASSAMVRETRLRFLTHAGVEIGVASTKAFTCQLTALACLAIVAGKARGVIDEALEAELVQALAEVPRHMATVLRDEKPYETLAHRLQRARDVLYLGRGQSYPIALEGALKLKEISYIHAEGYAAGELKHGPIALIDENMPVIVIAPRDDLFEKTMSNMQEVAARGGQIVLISDADAASVGCAVHTHLAVPPLHRFVTPLVYALPVQLIAYHTAVFMGTDVDQPRNLAKSVTVE